MANNEWQDVFDIVSDELGYYAVFKYNGKRLNSLTPCEWPVYAESIAYNWVNNINNQSKLIEIMTEMTLLGREE